MTEKTDSKEREDFKRWAEGQPWIKDCAPAAHGRTETFGHWDTEKAWLAFQAGRASLAASAGSEPVAWTGGEEWEQLAWHLCAEEHGEDACDEVIWEGGPIPEPWGARWMKYESDAKRMIELVRRFYTHPSPPEGMVGGWTKAEPLIARSLGEWNEDDGPVVWWAWNGHGWAGESPWIGTPLASDWPDYHTHWTPAPPIPTSADGVEHG